MQYCRDTITEVDDLRKIIDERQRFSTQMNILKEILGMCIASRVSMVIVTPASGELGLIFSSLVEYYGIPGGINRPPPYDIKKILEWDPSVQVIMTPCFSFGNDRKRCMGHITFKFCFCK